MGLIHAAMGAAGGVLADQWKEYFYCDAIPETILAVKGQKRVSGLRSSNRHGNDNIISTGSIIAVAEGQCMLIVEQGKIVEVCAEPGEFIFDASTEPSIFADGLNMQSIRSVFQNIGKRFTFGGEAPTDQRVYYFNTKELIGNKYGTPSSVPFRVVDQRAGIDIDISVRCFGEYSYRITNPLLFYANICGNISERYERSALDTQLKTEFLTALQPAFSKISKMGIRYSELPGHTIELSDALNDALSAKWRELRGIEVISCGVSSIKAIDEDEQMLKEMQRNSAFRDQSLAAANMVGAKASAMQTAAGNQGAGAAMAFMGMNMAQGADGINIQTLYDRGQQQNPQQTGTTPANAFSPATGSPVTNGIAWTCSCGASNTDNFCMQCGKPRPAPVAPADEWLCPDCGTSNTGNFCTRCGKPRPAPVAPAGEWFCPDCGTSNTGNFCTQCGKAKPAPVDS